MELLSPAGSFPALQAAVANGADAVYFGGSLFNARLGAKNFDRDEMSDALDFCRLYGVKSYITMNTLTHDRDLSSALHYAAFLYEHGADALIIQDLGLFSIIHKYIPDFEMHSSTQMCISTLEGVRICEELGYKRVVLSRELSLSDIKHISLHSSMPLEVFVHGAMCMSFSGGCLFSSMVGGRSGNCGTCAQPCRKYAAVGHMPDKNDLCLSMSDLCMIDHIRELDEAGACSLKIEGRMKKPEYIASVTNAYRRAIDGAGADEIKELKDELFAVFNRGAFSTGYYFGDDCKTDRIARASSDDALLKRIAGRNPLATFPVDMQLTAHIGSEASLACKSSFGNVLCTGPVVQQPSKPITEQSVKRVTEQLSKLGGTYFHAQKISTDIDGFIPVSAVNDMRRRATDAVSELCRLRRKAPDIPDIDFERTLPLSEKPIVSAHVYNMEQALAAINAHADEVMLEYGEFSADDIMALQPYREKLKLCLALPVTLLHDAYDRMTESVSADLFDAVEINNLGQIEFGRKFSHMYGGYHLNVFNAATAEALLNSGLERITLSVELNIAQVREICKFFPSDRLTLHAYGRVVLMNLYHCPIKEHTGCGRCGAAWQTMYDSDGRQFPIIGTMHTKPCAVTRLFNCTAHDLMPKLGKIPEMNISLTFTKESADIVWDRITCALNGGGDALPGTTRGYFNR